MKDLYLRFEDEKEMQDTLKTFGFTIPEDQTNLFHPEICLDIVGVIVNTVEAPAVEDEKPSEDKEPPVVEGEKSSEDEEILIEEVPVIYIAEPGYHANIRVINDDLDITELEKFAITPKTPARVWA